MMMMVMMIIIIIKSRQLPTRGARLVNIWISESCSVFCNSVRQGWWPFLSYVLLHQIGECDCLIFQTTAEAVLGGSLDAKPPWFTRWLALQICFITHKTPLRFSGSIFLQLFIFYFYYSLLKGMAFMNILLWTFGGLTLCYLKKRTHYHQSELWDDDCETNQCQLLFQQLSLLQLPFKVFASKAVAKNIHV